MSTHNDHEMLAILSPINELAELADGHDTFQLWLAEKLLATGRPVHELTIAEAMAICHDAILTFNHDVVLRFNGDHE